jgi:hypothetical protein
MLWLQRKSAVGLSWLMNGLSGRRIELMFATNYFTFYFAYIFVPRFLRPYRPSGSYVRSKKINFYALESGEVNACLVSTRSRMRMSTISQECLPLTPCNTCYISPFTALPFLVVVYQIQKSVPNLANLIPHHQPPPRKFWSCVSSLLPRPPSHPEC